MGFGIHDLPDAALPVARMPELTLGQGWMVRELAIPPTRPRRAAMVAECATVALKGEIWAMGLAGV